MYRLKSRFLSALSILLVNSIFVLLNGCSNSFESALDQALDQASEADILSLSDAAFTDLMKITVLPTVTATENGQITISVELSGTHATRLYSLQWEYSTTGTTSSYEAIPGSNKTLFTIDPVILTDAGFYRARMIFRFSRDREIVSGVTRLIVNQVAGPTPTAVPTSAPQPTVTPTSVPVPTAVPTAAPTSVPVSGAPTISSASASGTNIKIYGSNFGAKLSALPIVYDNFESGAANQDITGRVPTFSRSSQFAWRDYRSGNLGPRYSSQVTRPNSTISSFHQYSGATGYNVSLQLIYPMSNSGDEVYFTFWRYYDRTSSSYSRNMKPWMVWGSTGVTPVSYIGWGFPDIQLRNAIQDSGAPGSTLWAPDNSAYNLYGVEDRWLRFEVYLKQSSPGINNGAFQVWIHGANGIERVLSNTSYVTRGANDYWQQWMFGAYHATDTADASANVYLDDLYFDSSPARVELCDSPNWSSRTKCEIQVTTTWASGEITFVPRLGAFSASGLKYLYVIDVQGRASNSIGVQF